MKHIAILALCLALPLAAMAEDGEKKKVDYRPEFHGTVRAKYEYQPEVNAGRFQVRNARISVSGNVAPIVAYKAEIDLSDEGQIKMLDAYTRITPLKDVDFTIGQMRVPFTIDAHRSPHQQYFANRSFIAKQVGDVRDVGLALDYSFDKIPLKLEGGLFNGSGLTDQKDYWTRSLNFSAKAQYMLPFGLTLQGSVQKISPTGGAIYLYDGGMTLQRGRWIVEAEYMRKHYSRGNFPNVNAVDAFVCYGLPLRGPFHKLSFLARFDMMDDHSEGVLAKDESTGLEYLPIDDGARKRITGGMTLSFVRQFHADLRLNYEKYFYDDISRALPSERDKIVLELVVHFPYKKK